MFRIRISEVKITLDDLDREKEKLSVADADHKTDPWLTLAAEKNLIRKELLRKLKSKKAAGRADELNISIYKKSIDARKKDKIKFTYIIDAWWNDEKFTEDIFLSVKNDPHIKESPDMHFRITDCHEEHQPENPEPDLPDKNIKIIINDINKKRPVVIGSGPAGFMAALVLAKSGLRPLILERGKNVRDRARDTFLFWRKGVFNPYSNVQFGEGGAGTFSDGKLNTQIKDPRFAGRFVLEEFVNAGAPPEILYSNKPHVGTYRLMSMLPKIRRTIESLGGEYRFESHVTDFIIESGEIRGLVVSVNSPDPKKKDTYKSYIIETDIVILAPGHSARDTFSVLHERGVFMEPKPFSVGFRIEHLQSWLNHCRYGTKADHPLLGAADYKLVHHASNGRSVYSFCMCPGGTVVAATSEEGCVVTNGMSQYSRNETNANAGIVVGVNPEDFLISEDDPLGGIAFQRELEQRAFEMGGRNYFAPGSRVGDFLEGRSSKNFTKIIPSYRPGVKPSDLSQSLPSWAVIAIREALPQFDKQMKGFAAEDAVLTAVETRTSSPVRITRNPETLESISVRGLYPAGEGAGYAGGILSAAIDGVKAAEKVICRIKK